MILNRRNGQKVLEETSGTDHHFRNAKSENVVLKCKKLIFQDLYRCPPKESANEKKYRVAVVGRMAHLDRAYSAAQFQLQRIEPRDGRPRHSSRHLDRRRPIAFQGDDRGRTYAMR